MTLSPCLHQAHCRSRQIRLALMLARRSQRGLRHSPPLMTPDLQHLGHHSPPSRTFATTERATIRVEHQKETIARQARHRRPEALSHSGVSFTSWPAFLVTTLITDRQALDIPIASEKNIKARRSHSLRCWRHVQLDGATA